MNLYKVLIEFASPEYDEMVALRTEILRKPLGLVFTEEQLAEEYKDYLLGLRDSNDELVACCNLTPLTNEILKMRQVAVLEHLQGQGLGKILMDFAEEFAIYKGYKKFELNARNTAVPFYLKLNYEIEGDEFIEVTIPHRKMIKNLVK